ncbi:MAG: HAMP domain-containing sensor histidine kinase [Actinomycetota bacterium]
MRRRIVEAIVGVAAAVLLAVGIPLAIAIHTAFRDAEVVELQATAARTLVEIGGRLDHADLERIAHESDDPSPFAVYDAAGERLFGFGPATADGPARGALAGVTSSATDGAIVVATPITDRASEKVIGALRLSESLSEVDHRARFAWLRLAGAALIALALGWAVARRLGRVLSRPLTELVAAAERLGDGGVFAGLPPSHVAEIDTLSAAFADSSRRVNDVLARERRFSADVSHQLRTPLTRLRLRLEHDLGIDAVEPALDDLARLEQTVDHLLAFSRDAMPASATVRLDVAAAEAAERWHQRARTEGRGISVAPAEPIVAKGSHASVEQILDVLVDNALGHGAGDIHLVVRRLTGGAAIDVTDQGAGIAPGDEDRIFERGYGRGTGIGLSFARSIAEAEGGRLLIVRARPLTLSLILLGTED